MRKAYIILAHKNQSQLARLIRRLDDGSSFFFIHVDLNAKIDQTQLMQEGKTHINFVPGIKTAWGSFDLVQATLNALNQIKATPVTFNRITLLSGQDYPIKSNEAIDRFYIHSAYTIFMDHSRLPNYKKWTDGGLYRLNKYFWGFSWYYKYAAKTANFLSLFFRFFRRRLKRQMRHYHGSQWWTIDHYAMHYILDFVERHPEYVSFHRHTFAPDELFFQTILRNAPDSRISSKMVNPHARLTRCDRPIAIIINPAPINDGTKWSMIITYL